MLKLIWTENVYPEAVTLSGFLFSAIYRSLMLTEQLTEQHIYEL